MSCFLRNSILDHAPSECSDNPVHLQAVQSFGCPQEAFMDPWLSVEARSSMEEIFMAPIIMFIPCIQ